MELLKALPVVIVGDWKPVSQVGSLLWEGSASAAEPITSLALAKDATGRTEWGRAPRGKSQGLPISFRVSPLDRDNSPNLSVLALSVGGARVTVTAALTSAAPFQFSLESVLTGTPAWLARVRTSGKVRLGALFVAESDTQSARNHLWHLGAEKQAIKKALTDALNYGSSGSF